MNTRPVEPIPPSRGRRRRNRRAVGPGDRRRAAAPDRPSADPPAARDGGRPGHRGLERDRDERADAVHPTTAHPAVRGDRDARRRCTTPSSPSKAGYEPFTSRLTAPPSASSTAAAAAAARRVLVGFLPDHAATFDAALAASLADVPDGPEEDAGVAVGEAAGWGVLAARSGDGTQSGPVPALPAPGPGVWQPTPPATNGLTPWLATARPYSMSSPDRYRPEPPELDSGRHRRDLDEVRRLGSATSTERTAEQTETARFWADQPDRPEPAHPSPPRRRPGLGHRAHCTAVRRGDDLRGRRPHRLLGRQIPPHAVAALAVGARRGGRLEAAVGHPEPP